MELIIAMTYGQALIDAAIDRNKVDEIRAELIEVDKIFEVETDYVSLLSNPAIPHGKKKALIRNVFKGRISEEVLALLYILVDKNRFIYYHKIVKEYKRLVDVYKGCGKGKVYSAVPLREDQMEKLEEDASKLLRKKIRLKNVVDESVLGGVRLLVDGKLIDASVRGRLEKLSKEIEQF